MIRLSKSKYRNWNDQPKRKDAKQYRLSSSISIVEWWTKFWSEGLVDSAQGGQRFGPGDVSEQMIT